MENEAPTQPEQACSWQWALEGPVGRIHLFTRGLGSGSGNGSRGGLQCELGCGIAPAAVPGSAGLGSRVKAAQPAGCHLGRSGGEWARRIGGGGRERPDSGSIC